MTDKGYTVGGKYREREVTPMSHPHKPKWPVPPLQPEHIDPEAKMFANRVDMLYADFLKGARGGVCAEMGVYEGLFAGHVLNVLRPKEYHLLDLNTDPLIREIRTRSEVTVKEGDSSTNLSVYPNGKFDFIYIDGDHGFDGCLKDANVARLKVKVGGILTFNDYTNFSLYEQAEYGVPAVVNDLICSGFGKVVGFAFYHDGYHDIAVRRDQ